MEERMYRRILLCLFVLFIQMQAFAYAPVASNSLEIKLNEIEEFDYIGNKLISITSGLPLTITNISYDVQSDIPIEMASQYLRENAELLGFDKNLKDIKYLSTYEAQSGYRVRFAQTVGGREVYKSTITISINWANRVTFVSNGYKAIPDDAVIPGVTQSDQSALSAAKSYLGVNGTPAIENVESIFYASNSIYIPAYKVEIYSPENGSESWELLVNASSGEIFRVEDTNCYHPGYAFDPDPITKNLTSYGRPGYGNNGGADNDSLHASLVDVTFDSLTFSGGNYYLINEKAEVVDFDAPSTGLYEQASDTFQYSRDHESFEAVNIFLHVNQVMSYLRDTLQVNAWPHQYPTGLKFDPDGFNGAANAFYSGFGGFIAFGKPISAVDAGEDHAIVLHEIGHGIHDWVTNGNLSQVDGLSEGCADYWAQSYTRSLGIYEPDHAHYDYFGRWGIQPFQSGQSFMRRTDFPGHYPESLGGSVHYNGQLWSSSLMSIYDIIGKEICDRLLLDGLSRTSGNTGQVEAALAFIASDIDLYNGDHLTDIINVFNDRGYMSETIDADFSTSETVGEPGFSVIFTDQSSTLAYSINSWAWDFDSDGTIDSDIENPTWTYENVGVYDVTLTVASEIATKTIVKTSHIAVNDGVLVYDNRPENADNSGQFIRDFLNDNSIEGVFYSTHFPPSLIGFEAVFLSYGNLGPSYYPEVLTQDWQLEAIHEYLVYGGNVYLESGLPFRLHGYPEATNLYNTAVQDFGIYDSELNSGETAFTSLTGLAGSLAEGLSFESSNQLEMWHLESYEVGEGGRELLNDETLGTVAVLNESNPGAKTVVFSYSLSQLVDGNGDNTRAELLGRICNFFGLTVSTFTSESGELVPENFALYANYPNPFNPETNISFDVPFTSNVSITVYDVLGREVVSLLNDVVMSGNHTVSWNGKNSYSSSVSSGVYFLRMEAKSDDGRSFNNSRKMLLLK
jgi:PKD repeat protein